MRRSQTSWVITRDVRKHYAEWSPARQSGIDDLIRGFRAIPNGQLKTLLEGFSELSVSIVELFTSVTKDEEVFETTNQWLEIAQKNKTLVILWGAFVACLAYAINDSAGLVDKRTALRDAAATIEGLQAEHKHFEELVHTWEKCLDDLASRATAESAELTPDRLVPSRLPEKANGWWTTL